MKFLSPIPADRRLVAGADASPAAGRRPLVVALAVLFVGTFLLYLPTLRNDFIYGYDDDEYVMSNEAVRQGLTPSGVVWAFTTAHFANWLPVTWLSHMLDVSVFGLDAGGHHATSAAIHGANAALLLLALRRLTGRFAASLAVAVLFAVHPLRVESVAWVAERKDVLAALFFLLAVLAYARYAERPTGLRYLVVAACHALGLMSKTMLVTLPFVLLLLDAWPLGRWRFDPADRRASALAAGRLAWEKVPLLVLSAVASAWTVVLQNQGGALGFGQDLSLAQRLANALVSVPRYLAKMAVPADLAIPYPHPGDWPAWQVAASGGLILLVSAGCWAARRRAPYLLAGWLWFLGMLLPVSGVVQAGYQSMADRYTYIPGIGVALAVVWAAADGLRRWRASPRVTLGVGAAVTAAAAAACGWLTVRQEAVWRDEPTLFAHAVAATDGNWLAHSHVGRRLVQAGDVDGGMAHLRQAAAFNPNWADPHHNLGVALVRKGQPDAAVAEYRQAVRLDPKHYLALYDLGVLLLERGQAAEAADVLTRLTEVAPAYSDGQLALSRALAASGRTDEAARRLKLAAAADGGSALAQYNLGNNLLRSGKPQEAEAAYRESIRQDPANPQAHYNLGVVLSSQRRGPEALAVFAEAARLKPDWADARVAYGRNLAEAGRFAEAEEELAEAVRLAPENARAQQMLAQLRSRPGRQ